MMHLEDIEKIKHLKFTYFRAVDTKDWDLLRSCFAEDAESRYENGTLNWFGRENIISGLRPLIGKPSLLTQHQGHHPIITLLTETTATGSWYLQDMCFELEENWWFHGTAYYSDEYIKINDEWQIHMTGFDRVFLVRESPLPHNMRVEYDMFARDR